MSVMTDADVVEKYQKMTHREHVLYIPDTYVGSASQTEEEIWLIGKEEEDDKEVMTVSNVVFSKGLYKILDELIVNVYDQQIRTMSSKKANQIRNVWINIQNDDDSKSVFSIKNDGDGIDIAMHPEHNIYTVELIFGHLLTGTNYDKENLKEKLTGGKNGYGAKLTNIFSKKFKIETVDARSGSKYCQVFRNNMVDIEKPKISKCKKSPYTEITIVPDLARFGMAGWTETVIKIIEKRAYELSMMMGAGVNVYFNNEKVPVKSLERFMEMYSQTFDGKVYESYPRWQVGACVSNGFQHVSFVNGVCTQKGGKHVDYVANQICRKISDMILAKKKIKVKISTIRDNLMIFVNSKIVNPSFDSQTKDTLTTPSAAFGSKCTLSDKFIDKLAKIGLMERSIAVHEFKENKLGIKDGRKKRRVLVPKLEDANKAGGAESNKCVLILTEGDSAKTMAVSGLSIVGRDYYGVFPLKGKMINCRDKRETAKGREQILNNVELNNIKKILGLEHKKVYSSVSGLRYGSVMIMADQDVDGSHIKALFINYIESNWPELLSLGFINSMLTPIIKIRKKKKEKMFYSIGEFQQWQGKNSLSGWTIKYYKGLGTSTASEARQYFSDLKKVHYEYTDNSSEKIDMLFNRNRANDRKSWMTNNYDIQKVIDSAQTEVKLEEFVDNEVIHFSVYDLKRSIGSLLDGLKPSQRKIMFSCFKRKLRKEIKVAQLAGFVSEHAGYHHGEESLNNTIVGMAQNFVGSNNINLLDPNGQFGTRLQGGKDHASPRYVFTRMNDLTERLFPEEDLPLLPGLEDDGTTVEPSYYKPIIPIVLANGMRGIGTGWSTEIPCFNPLQISAQYRKRIQGVPFKSLVPYYRGFTGVIEPLLDADGNADPVRFLTRGRYAVKSFKLLEVTELPVEVWTDDYKQFLETLLDDYQPLKKKTGSASKHSKSKAILKGFTNYSTVSKVKFVLEFKPEVMIDYVKRNKASQGQINLFEQELRLTSKLSLSNMHLFDENEVIHRYKTVEEIMEGYYGIRLECYEKRQQYQLDIIAEDIRVLENKYRFVKGVNEDVIIIHKKTRNDQRNEVIFQLPAKNAH
jgi:DNA topoisomerase-2